MKQNAEGQTLANARDASAAAENHWLSAAPMYSTAVSRPIVLGILPSVHRVQKQECISLLGRVGADAISTSHDVLSHLCRCAKRGKNPRL